LSLNLFPIYPVLFFQTILLINQTTQQVLIELPRNALHFLWGVQYGALVFISIVNCFSYLLTWYRGNRKDDFPTGIGFFEPEVSIIVCTKNEEDNIGRLLGGLIKQEYPPEKFEIIVVDESTDRTVEIVKKIQKETKLPQIHLLERKKLPPKPENFNPVAYGITLGVQHAKHEIIVITEADCIHPQEYLRYFIQPYNPNYSRRPMGAVGSHPIFVSENGNTVVANMQRLDYSGNVFHNFAALDTIRNKAGMSIGLWGGSLSFKKSVFYEIGGFSGIEHYLVQDIMITDKIVKHGYRIMMLFDPRVKVETIASPTMQAAISQRFRWYKGMLSTNWQFITASTVFSFLPFFFENIAAFLIGSSLFYLLVPNPFHFPHELIFTVIFSTSCLVVLYVYRYVRLYQISKSRIMLKKWKNNIFAILLYGFWEWLINWIFFLSLFRKTIIWR